MIGQISIAMLIFGFGFVIFFHELGHFLAAKWVGIKVEQFAVGFGQALISWRMGMGFHVGSTARKYEELVNAQIRQQEGPSDSNEIIEANSGEQRFREAAEQLGLGETEYRLNWIPLGGYVKMLGQDDLKPNAKSDDPRAYNRKSIGARMFVVSAGVIMNILLAAIGFMALFLMGFRVQPPVVGSVQPNSPAAQATLEDGKTHAPVRVGDRILYYDGKFQHDFTKITLNVALSGEGPLSLLVERVGGRQEHLLITPRRPDNDPSSFLMVGVGGPMELRGLDQKDEDAIKDVQKPDLVPPDITLIQPGDVITAINGQAVKVNEYYKLDEAIQASNGAPVKLTVQRGTGKTDEISVKPRFATPFPNEPLNFAGLIPRSVVEAIQPESPAKDKLQPRDIILQVSFAGGVDPTSDPTAQQLIEKLNKAGQTGQAVDVVVLRDEKELTLSGLTPNVKVAKQRYGLGMALATTVTGDDQHPVVAGTVEKSPAAVTGVPNGALITSINGAPVRNWFDVKRLLASAKPETPVKLTALTKSGEKNFEPRLDPRQIVEVAGLTLGHSLQLHDLTGPRHTSNPIEAAAWGVGETRDFVLQFYMTLHRMFTGSVSYKNMMGPVGIFTAGTHFAHKGPDWLLWFLSMISANLAVVNFLPIPIVDGGLFAFLIIEKIQGRPLSPKMQSIAQVVGLAILLSVFLLVTYQDVTRHTGW